METETNIKVRGFHIDHFGHVNNARYLEFLEEGRWDYCEKNRLIDDLFHKTGIIHVVKEIRIKYLKPAFAGNIIRIATCVKEAQGKEITMSQTAFLEGSKIKIAEALIVNTLFDLHTNAAVEITPEVTAIWQDLYQDFS